MVQTEAGTKESLTALEDGERERERERESERECVCIYEQERERDFFLGLPGNTVRNHTGPQG